MEGRHSPKTRERQDPIGQTWWRFSRYELREGYIQPAPDATLIESSPWDTYWAGRRAEEKGQQPPYQSLSALVDSFHGALDTEGSFVPTAKAIDALLDWCQQYGLLGLLLHEAQMAFFPPRTVMATPDLDPKSTLEPTWALDHIIREPGEWHARTLFCSPSHGEWIDDDEEVEPTSFASAKFKPCEDTPACSMPEHWPSPHVLARNLRWPQWDREPLDKAWFPYFPQVSDHSRPTPHPQSSEFWAIYAEPLESFLRAAVLIRSAMEFYVNQPKRRGPFLMPDVPTHSTFRNVAYLAPDPTLQRMLVGVSPAIATDDKTWTHRQLLVAPSLLGMFAAMLVEDLTRGRTMRTCVACSTLFVAGAHESKYCSATCRSRIIKKRLRERIAEARTLRAKGTSLRDIASHLGSNIRTVKGWIGPETKKTSTGSAKRKTKKQSAKAKTRRR